jgi:hypothetical protein
MFRASRTLATLMIFLISLPSCLKQSDTNQNEAATYFSLRLWGDYTKDAYKARLPIYEQRTLDEALALLRENKLLNDTDYKLLANDGWGRRFRWRSSGTDGAFTITITSDGKDGLPQDGAGDDIVAIIQKPESSATIAVSIRP